MKKWFPIIVRVLLGLIFIASGVSGFVIGFQTPPDLPEPLRLFNEGLKATVYFMPFLKSVEIVCGIMLLTNLWSTLALIILAPILINIILVHAFMAPEGIIVGLVLGAFAVYLSFFVSPHKERLKGIFSK